jgi:hypothetical protein
MTLRLVEMAIPEHTSEEMQQLFVYFAMVVLSAIVATIGLDHNSVAVAIGAMVIAPLLGPEHGVGGRLRGGSRVHDGCVGDVGRGDGGDGVVVADGDIRPIA